MTSILDTTPEPWLCLDVEFRCTLLNQAAERLLGVRRDEVLGRVIWAARPGLRGAAFEHNLLRAMAERVEVTFEMDLDQGKGRFSAVATPDGDGGLVVRFADAGVSREVLQTVLNALPVRVFWKDRNLAFQGCNEPFARDAGFSETADIIGKDDYDLATRENADRYRADDRAVMETGEPKLLIEEPLGAEGTGQIHLLTSKVPLRDATGETLGVLGLYFDVTERRQAEEKLRASEEALRALIAGLPDIVMRFDREFRHLFVSDNIRDIGLDAGHFLGKTHRELGFAEEDCQRWEAAIRRVFETGSGFETEVVINTGNRPLVYSWRLVPERDAAGRVRSVLTLSRNITAHRQAEENYRVLFREMLDGFALHELIVDDNGNPVDSRILAVNPAFERIIGLTEAEVVGRTVLETIPGASPAWFEIFAKVVWTGKQISFDAYNARLRKHFAITAFRSAPGQYAVILADITARREAREQLRESEARFRSAFDESPVGATIVGLDHRFLRVNEALCRMTGYSAEELVGITFPEITHPDDLEADIEQARRLGAGEIPQYSMEKRYIRKTGETIWGRVAARMVRDSEGRPAYCLRIIEDMTEVRRAEDERAKLQEQLYQAQKMESIGRLAGGVAHDFNNLLTVINGYCEMSLQDVAPGDRLHTRLKAIHAAGDQAATLTRQLLAYSRKQVLQPRRLDLNLVLEQMRPLLSRLVGEDVELGIQVHRDPVPVHADPSQLNQVLMNLVANARDAMPRGGVLTIESSITAAGGGNSRFACIAVTDTGVGMDDETRRHIFEPFFTTKEFGKGTGLGLSMIEGIVTQSGGRIDVVSAPGRGSSFRIFLPLVVEQPAESRFPRDIPEGGGRETILVVEDQAEVREFTATVLETYGFQVIRAESAIAALTICERQPGSIDVVLTDLVMPNVSGRELADELEKVQPGIRILFMSGYTDDAMVRHGVSHSGGHFIQKPFSPRALVAKIREVLETP